MIAICLGRLQIYQGNNKENPCFVHVQIFFFSHLQLICNFSIKSWHFMPESTDIWMVSFYIISHKLNSFSQSLKNILLIYVLYFYLYHDSKPMLLELQNKSKIKFVFLLIIITLGFQVVFLLDEFPIQVNSSHYNLMKVQSSQECSKCCHGDVPLDLEDPCAIIFRSPVLF